MAFVPIPNGVRVVHLGRIGNVQIVNTIGAQNGDVAGGSSLKDIAQRHGDAWRASIVTALTSKYTHEQTLCYSLEDQSFPVGEATFTATQVGGGGPQPEALNVCMVFAFKTDKRGRTYAGRMFLSGLTQGAIAPDGVSWNAGTVADMQARMRTYKGAVDPAIGHNGRMAVTSKGSPGKGIAPGVTPVTTILARVAVGTQRRRLY